MIKFRNLVDIRMVPLLIGTIQVLWGLRIASVDHPRTLFKLIEALSSGDEWGWLMSASGIFLMGVGVFKGRHCLTTAILISAFLWSIMTIIWFHTWYWYRPEGLVTALTLQMPVIAACLWYEFFREVYLHPRVVSLRKPNLSDYSKEY